MKKYIQRYLIFWLPAVLVAYFYNNETMLSQVLQWFTAFFMVFAWSVNTAMAAYHLPKTTMSVLLCYAGLNCLLIVMMYFATIGTVPYVWLRTYGGFLSFKPLDIMVQTIKPFSNLPWELCVTGFLVACCIIGYIVGIIQRRVRPNPYRPRMGKAL